MIKKMSNTDPKSFGNSLKEVQDKNNDFKKFRNKEKPEKAKEKAEIQIQLINLQTKQKQEGVPVYQPPKEISPESINNNWGKLDSTQKNLWTTIKRINCKNEIFRNDFR